MIGALLLGLLGGTFLFAGLMKLTDLESTQQMLGRFTLVTRIPMPSGTAVAFGEIVVAVASILSAIQPWLLVLPLGATGVIVAGLAMVLKQSDEPFACACFGAATQAKTVTGRTLGRAIVLLTVAIVAAILTVADVSGRSSPTGWLVGALGVSFLLLTAGARSIRGLNLRPFTAAVTMVR